MEGYLSRIEQIAELEGIKITTLEAQIGASKAVLTRPIAKGGDIGVKWLVRIVENYPQYNANWILTGKGEMLNSPENKESPDQTTKYLIDKLQELSSENGKMKIIIENKEKEIEKFKGEKKQHAHESKQHA